ncbi:MAG TPA: tyrosine-protein phosphatase [Phycisphaerae bacterium]|jgi:protein-tyrosine phosphatase|nr:hypothetical protein [Phycisphaerae bacterium]HOB73211.1 tyrosine-protein phosphatase [Phycisphaerae bacterium]HOJ55124.1 tyrosine-protein phosphatase [Phycisphaerae bacterium]HOL27909.1 tyrosine-protein phosphatase [Phycisphaerae bacterium]HPP21748.1 tyrosine-protein phosphatase [Phycisphaerae bacterium]
MVESRTSESFPARQRRRRNLLLMVALLTAGAAGVTFKYTRHHLFPKRFAIVEPGRLYRSGYCEPGPLTRIIRKHKIRTILTLLNDEPDSEEQRKEEEVVRREGVRLIRIGMPGNGCADFDLLEQAADIIADPTSHPLLVHCYAGSNRTGACYAVWRMKHCGWSWREALDECQDYGLSPRYSAKLFEHLKRYYIERIEPASKAVSRPATRPPEP